MAEAIPRYSALLKEATSLYTAPGRPPYANPLADFSIEGWVEQGRILVGTPDDVVATLDDLRSKGIRLIGDPGAGNAPRGQVFVHPSATGGVLTQLVQR